MYKTILVAVDGSAHAKRAVKAGAGLAARLNARLVLLHVLMRDASVADIRRTADVRRLPKALRDEMDALEMPVAAAAMGGGFVMPPATKDILQAVGKQILAGAEGVAGRLRVRKATSVMADGDAATAILTVAGKQKADLIVIGSRGLSTFKELILGSVSHKVAQLAKSAVLIVK